MRLTEIFIGFYEEFAYEENRRVVKGRDFRSSLKRNSNRIHNVSDYLYRRVEQLGSSLGS